MYKRQLETVAKDILLLKSIPCRMAGIGPFISNPRTPLAGSPDGDPELARRAVAVARLLLPDSNLPLTTSLSILAGKEQYDPGEPLVVENPFAFGANVVMKKATPDKYKEEMCIRDNRILRMRFWGDYRHSEIAEILNININTEKSIYRRSLKKLRDNYFKLLGEE